MICTSCILNHLYVVKDEVWKEAGLIKSDVICPACLSDILRRRLVPTDFTDAPCNKLLDESRLTELAIHQNILKNKHPRVSI